MKRYALAPALALMSAPAYAHSTNAVHAHGFDMVVAFAAVCAVTAIVVLLKAR